MYLSFSTFRYSSSDMIYENNPITNAFVSLPVDLSQFNCATFIAGIISGILDSAKFVSIIIHSLNHSSPSRMPP